jgi:PRTRC genetic system protein F
MAVQAGRHFEAGVLRASDVQQFNGAGDAVAQALFAWIDRQCDTLRRVCCKPALFDAEAVREQTLYHEGDRDFDGDSPLYLGIETPEDYIYFVEERAALLRAAHPRLLATALILINRASFRTLIMRTPDDFLALFAQWHWDGDPYCTDEESLTFLAERFGDDKDEFVHFLPSVVRDELCPDNMMIGRYNARRNRWQTFNALGIESLRRLGWTQTGWIRQLCVELEELTLLLSRAGSRQLFDWAFRPETVYAATSIAAIENPHVADVLDTHYEYYSNGGDGSLFHGFVALANDPVGIRKQYAEWSLGFSILRQVDRIAALISYDPQERSK